MRPFDVRDALVRAGLSGGAVHERLLDRVAHANDASHYVLTPRAVVVAEDADTVARVMAACARAGLPLTFRSGGTSLSGQAVTDGVLVDTRRHFRGIEVLEMGKAVRVQPGATVRAVNAALAPYGRKLGPDPASEAACTIGGVVANNSSGMTCGTQGSAYRTLRSLRFVLPSGSIVDTAERDADARLATAEPELHRELGRLRDRLRGDHAMAATIAAQFSMKNTMGYGLNSFVDFDRVADILAHLVVGSEGTLAFVASATFDTLPILPESSTGLMVFPGLAAATEALPALVDSGAAAIELLDSQSLRVASGDPRCPPRLRALTIGTQAAFLVEYQAGSRSALAALVDRAGGAFPWTESGGETLTTDPQRRADLWHVRKGLYAAVAGAKRPGTTALLEDVAVPVPALSDTCAQLIRILGVHGYQDSVIFGHAKDGNIHFMLSERFDEPGGVERYAAFTDEMVDLVLGQGGTLKAEHGTGRVMASFVRRQYGDALYDVMRAVKQLCDPLAVLNPGVLLSDDPGAHLRALKRSAPVEEEVDRCVECGFCEPVCPSRDLTLTPRQRIVVRRAVAAAQASGDAATAAELSVEYDYDGLQTCAADGMCQTACPVAIDTGQLVRRLRGQNQGPLARRAGTVAARSWPAVSRVGAAALTAAQAMPAVAEGVTRAARRVASPDVVPLWTPDLPHGGSRRQDDSGSGPVVAVVFASCTGAVFGTDTGGSSADALRSLCRKAGVPVATTPGMDSLCCGMPWSSKGLTDGASIMANRVGAMLWRATDHGRLPVVADASSCTEGLEKALAGSGIQVQDAVTFAARELLPRLRITHHTETIAVHPTCSTVRMGTVGDLMTVAAALGERTFVPRSWGCCGFAGDRGMLHPELTASATAAQAMEIRESAATLHVSCNRTCELGMSRAVGRTYEHVLEALDGVSAPVANQS